MTRMMIVVHGVQAVVVTILKQYRLFVQQYIPVLGIEDAISPLRMGIMINAELSFRVSLFGT